jgi:N-acetylglutamate synthase-like GNAT family acetyltransferase
MKKIIRKAEEKDIPEIIKLLFKLTSYEREILNMSPPDIKEVESRVNLDFIYDNGIEYYVCEIEEKIIGVIKVEKILNEIKLSEAYVEKEHRKKGIMTLLFEKCVEWGKKEKIESIYLTIVEGNEMAYNYWTNLGFYKSELRSKLITLRRKITKDIVK